MSRVKRMAGDPPSPFESVNGYSRVVVADGLIRIAGTTSVTKDGFVIGQTPYEQTREILSKLLHELSRVGATAEDVIETRIYVTDISRGEEVGRAHGEVFGSVKPTMTMVGVAGLFDPRMLVEIEAVALAPPTDG